MSSPEIPYPVLVREQVWESLVSMLRVYAHAASLNGTEYVVNSHADEAHVKHQDSLLTLHFDPDSGEAVWRITQPEREEWGAFHIQEDGALHFPAGPKALDAAAIEWIEQLVHVCSNESSVPVRRPLDIS
jgi:hypothetical protein